MTKEFNLVLVDGSRNDGDTQWVDASRELSIEVSPYNWQKCSNYRYCLFAAPSGIHRKSISPFGLWMAIQSKYRLEHNGRRTLGIKIVELVVCTRPLCHNGFYFKDRYRFLALFPSHTHRVVPWHTSNHFKPFYWWYIEHAMESPSVGSTPILRRRVRNRVLSKWIADSANHFDFTHRVGHGCAHWRNSHVVELHEMFLKF